MRNQVGIQLLLQLGSILLYFPAHAEWLYLGRSRDYATRKRLPGEALNFLLIGRNEARVTLPRLLLERLPQRNRDNRDTRCHSKSSERFQSDPAQDRSISRVCFRRCRQGCCR